VRNGCSHYPGIASFFDLPSNFEVRSARCGAALALVKARDIARRATKASSSDAEDKLSGPVADRGNCCSGRRQLSRGSMDELAVGQLFSAASAGDPLATRPRSGRKPWIVRTGRLQSVPAHQTRGLRMSVRPVTPMLTFDETKLFARCASGHEQQQLTVTSTCRETSCSGKRKGVQPAVSGLRR